MCKSNIEKFIIDIETEIVSESAAVNSDMIEEFFRYLATRADYYSLECYYYGKLSKEEYKGIKEEGIKYLEREYEAYKNNIDNYRETLKEVLGFTTEKEVKRYFKEMQRDYKENILIEAKQQKGYCPRINERRMKQIGMSESRLTCNTPSTMGGVRTICYFPVEHFSGVVEKMTTLYDYIQLDGFQFENLTCYKGDYQSEGSAFYITTTHESESTLCINYQEYKVLTDKGILIPCM